MKKNIVRNAGIWVRVSTEMQVEGDSPETHRSRGMMYADVKGWDVVEVYNLAGVSGKSVIEHPETQRMLSDVKSGKVQALIFSKLARLARNVRELLDISEVFKEHDAALVSLGESIDTSTPAGQLMYTMIGALAEWERSEISARVAASVPIRASAGKPTGGMAPWGYAWVEREDGEKRLEVDEDAAGTIRRIFKVCAEEGGNLGAVIKKCNALGIFTRMGSKWRPAQMSRFIDNPIYSGRRRANYSKSTGDGKHWVLKPEDEWVYHDVPEIIPKEDWDNIQQLREKRRGPHKGIAPPKTPKTLFGGLLVCGDCKEKTGKTCKMYRSWKSPKGYETYFCRECNQKVRSDEIEGDVIGIISTISVDGMDVPGDSDVAIHAEVSPEEIDRLMLSAEQIKSKQSRLLDLYVEGHLDKESLTAKSAEFSARYSSIIAEAKELTKIREESANREVGYQEAVIGIMSILDSYHDAGNDAAKRSLLDKVLSVIVVSKESIRIRLRDGLSDHSLNKSHTPKDAKPFQSKEHVSYIVENARKNDTKKPKDLPGLLKYCRKRDGWRQKDVAEFLGVSLKTINNWEKEGYRIPRTKRKIVKYFCCEW